MQREQPVAAAVVLLQQAHRLARVAAQPELLERGAQLPVVELARLVLVNTVEGAPHVAGDGVGQPVGERAHEPDELGEREQPVAAAVVPGEG